MNQLPRCDVTPSGSVLRANAWGQAFRLTEVAPHYDGSVDSVHQIIKWLGVEKGGRWKPIPGSTYCNVYATDFAHACGVFLPRVWWNSSAESALVAGKDVKPEYGKTVMELSANALFRWLNGPHSDSFHWKKTMSLTDAQGAANCGLPVVICCRKKVESSPGHIAVVAPETDVIKAKRDDNGDVLLPVLSQAGAKNEELGVASSWWESRDMAEWGVWMYTPPGA